MKHTLLAFILGLNMALAYGKVSHAPLSSLPMESEENNTPQKNTPQDEKETPTFKQESSQEKADIIKPQQSVKINQGDFSKKPDTINGKPEQDKINDEGPQRQQNLAPDDEFEENLEKSLKKNVDLWDFTHLSKDTITATSKQLHDLERQEWNQRLSLDQKHELDNLRLWHKDFTLFELYKKTLKTLNTQRTWQEYVESITQLVRDTYQDLKGFSKTAYAVKELYEGVLSQSEKQLFSFESFIFRFNSSSTKEEYLKGLRLAEETTKIWAHMKKQDSKYTLEFDKLLLYALSRYSDRAKSCDSKKGCLRVADDILRSAAKSMLDMGYSKESLDLKSLADSLLRSADFDRPVKILTLISKYFSQKGRVALGAYLVTLSRNGTPLTRQEVEMSEYDKVEKEKSHDIRYNSDEIQDFTNFLNKTKDKNSSKSSYTYNDKYYKKKKHSRYDDDDDEKSSKKKKTNTKEKEEDNAIASILGGILNLNLGKNTK